MNDDYLTNLLFESIPLIVFIAKVMIFIKKLPKFLQKISVYVFVFVLVFFINPVSMVLELNKE